MSAEAEQPTPMQQDEAPAAAEGTAPAGPAIVTPDAVKATEQAALNVHKKLNIQSAPIRQYLEASVVPTLMQGLQALVRERPENPVEYLAYFLLSNNPQGSKAPPAAAAATATPAAAPPAP